VKSYIILVSKQLEKSNHVWKRSMSDDVLEGWITSYMIKGKEKLLDSEETRSAQDPGLTRARLEIVYCLSTVLDPILASKLYKALA
jgi:hypothetical protein